MKTKSTWKGVPIEWSKDFRLGPEDRKYLIALTSVKVAADLETAVRDLVLLRDSEDDDPHEAALRQAFLRLRDWTSQGAQVLPTKVELLGTDRLHDVLDSIGWDLERFESFREDVESIRNAADRALSEIIPRRGNRTKQAQRQLARDVFGILKAAEFRPTSARNGKLSAALATLLNAARDSKDVHGLVEQTVRELKQPVHKNPRNQGN